MLACFSAPHEGDVENVNAMNSGVYVKSYEWLLPTITKVW